MRTIEDALEVLNTLNSQGRIEYAAYSELYDTIAIIETEPVRHGHWITWFENEDIRQAKCSECGMMFTLGKGRDIHYCGNCGAYMGVEDVRESD